MALFQVQAFGKLTLMSGSRQVAAFPTSRVEELCGYLLLHQGEALQRESLIELLWPNDGGENGRGRLNTTLWRLRKLIDELGLPSDCCFTTSRESITFTPQPLPEFDVSRFEWCLGQANAAADPVEVERLLRQAQHLYRGPLCEGIYSDWCLIERERLSRQHLRVLGRLMAACIGRRSYEEAISLGERILLDDPLREEAHRALITCYARMGLPSEAARQFQRCANTLMSELHILPMPETIEAYCQAIALQGRMIGGQKTMLQEAFEQFNQAADRLVALLEAEEQF